MNIMSKVFTLIMFLTNSDEFFLSNCSSQNLYIFQKVISKIVINFINKIELPSIKFN